MPGCVPVLPTKHAPGHLQHGTEACHAPAPLENKGPMDTHPARQLTPRLQVLAWWKCWCRTA